MVRQVKIVIWSQLVLSLFLVKSSLQNQPGSTGTLLTSLRNLVLDNSRTTVTFNSTALRTLLALSGASKDEPKYGVSFSVTVRAKELKLGPGQTIVYDGIFTNNGNGYDDRTGVFTCPVAGTYMFNVDSLSPKPTWLYLYLNKTPVACLTAHGGHNSGTYLQMSRTVILSLKKGDHVKVVVSHASTAVHHFGYSGFSGARLS